MPVLVVLLQQQHLQLAFRREQQHVRLLLLQQHQRQQLQLLLHELLRSEG